MVTEMSDRCPACGSAVKPGQKFCGACGAPIRTRSAGAVMGTGAPEEPSKSRSLEELIEDDEARGSVAQKAKVTVVKEKVVAEAVNGVPKDEEEVFKTDSSPSVATKGEAFEELFRPVFVDEDEVVERELVFAKGLPGWDLLPPDLLVERRRHP